VTVPRLREAQKIVTDSEISSKKRKRKINIEDEIASFLAKT
jgi:uncharacterized protein YdcH (DUF465 family)